MGSNFQYTIDINEDQYHQPFFSPLGSSLLHHHHFHHQGSSNPSPSTSQSLSYFPFLINSHQDQVHLGYNSNTFHGVLEPHLSQPLEITNFVSNGGSSSSDQVVPKKKTRLKLTIRKKDNYQEQTNLPQYPTKGKSETNSLMWVSSKVRLMKKKKTIITTDNSKKHVKKDQFSNLSNLEGDHHDHLKKTSANQNNIIVNENGYNGGNDYVIRICSDCNTTKTPLWRSGPRGPKSLCNACGIRQRKARRAAVAAATAASDVSLPPLLRKKMQNTNKISNGVYNLSSYSDREAKAERPFSLFQLCKMAEEHPEILFLKVNFDDNKSLCKSLNVKVLPYFHFYRGADGQVESFSCSLAKLKKLREAIERHNVGSQ